MSRKKRSGLNLVMIVIVLPWLVSMISCTGMNRFVGGVGFAEDEAAFEEPVEEVSDESDETDEVDYFYFSYDDSASTAAVELVKYQLGAGIVPAPGLARPWEFLNYEQFLPDVTEKLGLFDISFGLWERAANPGVAGDEAVEYQLGISVASPTVVRDTPCVLTLVIDQSGSMGGSAVQTGQESATRMEILQAGLEAMLRESLIAGDVLNVVVFEDNARTVCTGREFTQHQDYLLEVVANLEPGGSTNLDAGLEEAYDAALSTYDSEKTNRVVLLTDAWLNTGQTDTTIISDRTRINDSEGIYFAGVGISKDVNESALNELTEAGRGAYFACLTRQDAIRVFTTKFVALLEIAARDVRFRLDYPAGMEHSVTASEESSTVEAEVTPTNFSFNTSQYFFEGFTADHAVSGDDAFILTVSFKDPVSGEAVELTALRKVSDMLGRDLDLIRDAEAVFLLTELIGERKTETEVRAILDNHHEGYTSTLHREYVDLIDAYSLLVTTAE